MKGSMFRKINDIEYDFLPSELEIIERPPSPLGKSIILIISIFIATLIAWACLAKIDEIVVTSGQISPVEGLKVVDSNLNGKIIKINKQEGEKVKAGEVILEIDNINSEENEKSIFDNLEVKKLEIAIVNNKIDGSLIDYNSYKINEVKLKEMMLKEEIATSKEMTSEQDYEKRLREYDKTISEAKDNIDSLQKEYNLMSDVDKFMNGKSILDKIKSNEETVKNTQEQKDNAIKSKELEEKQKTLTLIQQKTSLESELKSLESNLTLIKNQNESFIIKSPIDGTILKLNYNTIDSYINQTKPIAEIVPDSGEFEIETNVMSKDIARIKEGQDVVIKVESYDYQKYGTLKGKVKSISPTAIVNENSGLVYKAKIEFDKNENSNMNILPGMNTTIEIKAEKMRVIDYFLDPFYKHIDNALKG